MRCVIRDFTLHVYCIVLLFLQLDTVNWRLNLQMAQSSVTKMKMPNALFELGVNNESTQVRVECTDYHGKR